MEVRQLTIIGVGLLGGSIGLAIRSSSGPCCRIIGCDRSETVLAAARERGAIDAGTIDPVSAVRGSDLVILCVPVGAIKTIIQRIGGEMQAGCILTDVASTKRSIVRWADALLPASIDFVASHPMAGGENQGIANARADLLSQRLCIVTPTDKTPPAALQNVEAFWRALSMRTTRLTPEDHDRLLADVSHLPHLVASALVAMQDPSAADLCGNGFLDVTRIAGGDGALWRDIILDNADNIRVSIGRLQEQLRQASSFMDKDGGEALRRWLNDAADRRRNFHG